MAKYPVVLILSEGPVNPTEIVNKIRNVPEDVNRDELNFIPGCHLKGYVLPLTTKYYKANLYLVPFEDDISLIPAELTNCIEAVLIYFDAGKRSFSLRIPTYAKYLKDNGIELGILLCSLLYDDANEGITYKEAKQESKYLDVIELDRTRSDEDDDDDVNDPLGYEEIHQALKSFIWSNVNVNAVKPINVGGVSLQELARDEDSAIEKEIYNFDKILTEIKAFQNASATMSHDEKLEYAEQCVKTFAKLIDDDFSSDDD